MIRGFMKTSSRTAMIVAAGMLMGAYAYGPAKAADLGGGCCADLEERVAELEATTARKGNRVVSLQVYGQVNKALMIWDDGVDSDVFVVDNVLSSSRFGFKGQATMKPGWIAGYNMEFELQDARADQVYQGKSTDDNYTYGYDGALLLRQNYWFIENDRLGRLSVGHQSTAADGAHEVVLAGSLRTSDVLIGNNFYVRDTDGNKNNGRLSNWASNLDSGRNDVVRYDTPSIYGFILSASWGDNDYSDVALRFKKEFNSIRVAAAVAYQWDNQTAYSSDFETVGGSISVMHVPTGLYAAFQAGSRDYKDADVEDVSFWYVQAGIERKWLPYGATTIYGEYGNYDDFAVSSSSVSSATSSEATRWGLGVNQKFDSVAMDIYAHATFWDFDHNSTTELNQEGLTTVLVGSRIQF